MTLQHLINKIKEFGNSHYGLNTTKFDTVDNISTSDIDYPLLLITPSNAITNDSVTTLNLDIYILDLEKQDKSNLETIISSTLGIGNDLIHNFFYDNDIEIVDGINSEVIEYEFDDVLAGWLFKLKVEFIIDVC